MSELSQHEQIVQAFNQYLAEAETFDQKGVKAAAATFWIVLHVFTCCMIIAGNAKLLFW